MKGTPGKPSGSATAEKIQVRIRVPDKPIAREEPLLPNARGLYIKKEEYSKHGFTPGCLGCVAIEQGVTPKPHNQSCRKRMLEVIGKDEAGAERIKQNEEKVNERLAFQAEELYEEEKKINQPTISKRRHKLCTAPLGNVLDTIIVALLTLHV